MGSQHKTLKFSNPQSPEPNPHSIPYSDIRSSAADVSSDNRLKGLDKSRNSTFRAFPEGSRVSERDSRGLRNHASL